MPSSSCLLALLSFLWLKVTDVVVALKICFVQLWSADAPRISKKIVLIRNWFSLTTAARRLGTRCLLLGVHEMMWYEAGWTELEANSCSVTSWSKKMASDMNISHDNFATARLSKISCFTFFNASLQSYEVVYECKKYVCGHVQANCSAQPNFTAVHSATSLIWSLCSIWARLCLHLQRSFMEPFMSSLDNTTDGKLANLDNFYAAFNRK